MKEPKDLKVVIKPKRQILWENLKTGAEKEIEGANNSIEINTELLKLANTKIKEF